MLIHYVRSISISVLYRRAQIMRTKYKLLFQLKSFSKSTVFKLIIEKFIQSYYTHSDRPSNTLVPEVDKHLFIKVLAQV